ncbi:hypothetical protein N7499_012035 [Penicillium canescens]|uniref:Uncharacterized protein n=1 Tax=Penicillium canescens TaxID=5083 RepID=A0AAD6ILC6_PENCN|nr:uncharacterized protein N7446_007310 [Penicillium canescens]KAJ5991383.1 hypothetical protein N7522_011590 [Penicillium canescens]KAJ6049359.1 hypothetical protein N7444_006075 [Penicillium canescens]KAJ6052668.1 hypothetical protein N7460_003202 [Penicillium canescens]KAJ6063190.1 hypothetical protein N7446_007310 [Penicillium canescens]KAJ6070148.1 hypothetical protein N7499_012035 [Penicillium canescens]
MYERRQAQVLDWSLSYPDAPKLLGPGKFVFGALLHGAPSVQYHSHDVTQDTNADILKNHNRSEWTVARRSYYRFLTLRSSRRAWHGANQKR